MYRVVVVLAVVIATSSVGSLEAQTPARTRAVYVSAIDASGLAVMGLTPADLTVREDGRTQPIVSFMPATEKMSVVLLVDDSGVGISDIRQGVANFVSRLLDRAEFCVIGVSNQNRTLVDFSGDERALANAVQSLQARLGSPGQHMIEAILDGLARLEKREAVRPVMVVLTNQSHETGSVSLRPVMDRLERSGVSFHVIEVMQPGFLEGQPAPAPDLSTFSEANEAAEADRVRRQVLTTGPSETGGLYRKAVSPAGVTAMMRSIASELLDQHQVVFGSTAKPGTVSKITMSIRRPGITLRAPSYAVSRNSR